MTHIGGFFELEPQVTQGTRVHPNALRLSTGRAAMKLMLTELEPTRVYMPVYTCAASLEPLEALGIPVVSYDLNEAFLPRDLPDLGPSEYLVYINYFGLCEEPLRKLRSQLGSQLLVDDTHAFFKGARSQSWSFTSARKYFGVPDGAFLFCPRQVAQPASRFSAISTTHLELRASGRQAEGFAAFQSYERGLSSEIFAISDYSERQLGGIDLNAVATARRRNYAHLATRLGDLNRLALTLTTEVPFCYPLLPRQPMEHSRFYDQHIYPPTLWPEVAGAGVPTWEQTLASELLPLPVDHRYGAQEMDRIVKVVRSL